MESHNKYAHWEIFGRKEEVGESEKSLFPGSSTPRQSSIGTREERNTYLDWLDTLSSKEKEAVSLYKSVASKSMNDFLRGVREPAMELDQSCRLLTNLIEEHSVQKLGIYYYGLQVRSLPLESFKTWRDQFVPGRLLNFKHFLSLSSSPFTAWAYKGNQRVLFEVVTGGALFTDTEEGESIVSPNSFWKVIDSVSISDNHKSYDVIQILRIEENE